MNYPFLLHYISFTRSRVRFMLDTIAALRTNNARKIPNYDPSLLEHMKKLLRGLVHSSGMCMQIMWLSCDVSCDNHLYRVFRWVTTEDIAAGFMECWHSWSVLNNILIYTWSNCHHSSLYLHRSVVDHRFSLGRSWHWLRPLLSAGSHWRSSWS